MKKLLKFINTLLFIITIGLTVLVSVGILVDDNPPIVGLSIILLFTGIILFLLFLWRKKLNQSKNPNTNISPNVQVERPQNVIPEQPSKNETVEPVKSDESISDGPKISESAKEESVSEDYRKIIILTLLGLLVGLFIWKGVQMIPSWVFFLVGTYVLWSIVRPYIIGFIVKITFPNVMVRDKSLMECFHLRDMINNVLDNIWVDWIVIPGILFSVLYISFSSGTNEFSGRLSERDVTGTYIFNMSDSERREVEIASAGQLQFEDQELVLSRNRSYKLTSWSRNNGEITSKVNGTWILESLSDTVWKNGEVLKVRFSNYIKLDDGKVFRVINDGNLDPYKDMFSTIVWKRE